MQVISFLRDLLIEEQNSNKFFFETKNNKKISYQEFHDIGKKIAGNLIKKGFKSGDRICTIVDNSLDTISFYLGCLFCGIVVIPINENNYEIQLDFIYKDSKSRGIFISNSEIFKSILIDSEFKILISEFVNNSIELNKKHIPFLNIKENQELLIIYTSGTTSKPKGVVHSYETIFNSAYLFSKNSNFPNDCCIPTLLPMSYLGGYFNLFLIPYINKASIIILEPFDAKIALGFWQIVEKYNINTLWLVPTMIAMLIKLDRNKNSNKSNLIKKCFVGTDFLGVKLRKAFESKYKINLFENYGLSETLFISTQNEENVAYGSVGKVIDGVEIQILDEKKNKINSEDEGEIFIKSNTLSLGYLNKDFELINNWFSTGDLGKIVKDNLYITGRKKDIIVRGGINISPAFIEEIVLEDKNINSAAIIGLKNDINGEDIVLIISLDEKFKDVFESKVFTQKINNKLPKHSKIKKTLIIDHIPKTSTGKIQRNKLKNWINKGDFSKIEEYKDLSIIQNNYFRPSSVVEKSKEAISITYNNLVYELKNKGKDIITLSLGEAFFDIPLFSFDKLPYPEIYHYSHSRGILKLRECLSKYFLENYGIDFNPNSEILITSGSKIAIHMSLMAILNPGDEVIILEPAWVSYTEQVKLCYGIPVFLPYYEKIFSLEKYITNRTKLIIINNPNNPSGKIYSLEELNYLLYLSEKYNVFILSDEAYSEFMLNKSDFISLGNLDKKKDRLLIVNSISKNYGISGWRLGYVIANEKLINQILKLNQHLVTCPPTILQYYIVEYFYKIIEITYPQIKELLNKRILLSKYMDQINLKYLDGSATFYFFISIKESSLKSESFCNKLLTKFNISAVPGIGYGESCDKFIRVSVGSESIERTKKALYNIKKLIDINE